MFYHNLSLCFCVINPTRTMLRQMPHRLLANLYVSMHGTANAYEFRTFSGKHLTLINDSGYCLVVALKSGGSNGASPVLSGDKGR